MTTNRAPLTPIDCDLRGLPFMPLHGERLIESDLFFLSTGEEFKAAVALWWASWKQVPAASLPDNDRVLAGLARVADAKRWPKVRETALRGWVLCSDGRLYHPVVAEVALQAWADRQAHREARASDTERKQAEREERKVMFSDLKASGIKLPWNTPTSDLRTRHADLSPPVQDLSRGQAVTCPEPVTGQEGTGKGRGTLEEVGLGRGREADAFNAVRRAQFESLKRALQGVSGPGLADISGAPGLMDLSPLLALLEPGAGPACDLEIDVLPVIRAETAKPRRRPVSSWSYFVPAIARARDDRLRGAPAQSEESHDDRARPAPAFAAGPNARRANTDSRRRAWLDLAAERDGYAPPGDGEPDGAPAPDADHPRHPRLAHAG